MQTVMQDFYEATQLERNAPASDFSVVAAREPILARAFDQLWTGITLRNSEGLSTMDLVEGTAIIYEHLMRGRDGLEDRLRAVWEVHGDTYQRAYDIAYRACGSRTLDVILPATALALRYSDPPKAFPVFLEKLKHSQPGEEIPAARALAGHPPRIPTAGRYLGTALDVRARQVYNRQRYRIYDAVLDELVNRAWGVDELDLLTEPSATEKLGDFPFPMITTDKVLRGKLEIKELVKRTVLGFLVLRTAKLPRYRKEAEKRFVDRFHAAGMVAMDPLQGADEFAHLGYKNLNSGNLDQAEVMYETALANYELVGSKEGMANAYFNLGLLHGSRKDLKRAEEMYRNSLEIFETLGKQEGIARAAANLGVVYMNCQNWHEAEPLIRKALAIEEAEDLKEGMAIDYCNLGRIYRANGDLVRAVELFGKSLKLYQEAGNGLMVRTIQSDLDDLDNRQRR
jgi:tetratricopeptide (TPR) repeat protein